MDKNKLKFISSEKKKTYAELWKKNKVAPVVEADEKAGYPPNCNEGYVEKDGKCVPTPKKVKAHSSLSQEGGDRLFSEDRKSLRAYTDRAQ